MSVRTMSSRQCAALLERAATWLDASEGFSYEHLEVLPYEPNSATPRLYAPAGKPVAILRLGTTDKILTSHEGPLIPDVLEDGLLYYNYVASVSGLPRRRRFPAPAVRALAQVAAGIHLPIFRAAGTTLDGHGTGHVHLALECAATEEERQAALYGVRRWPIVADNLGHPAFMVTQEDKRGLPLTYAVRVETSPPA